MFTSLGLFNDLPCPERPNCRRIHCLFSHQVDTPLPAPMQIVVDALKPALTTSDALSTLQTISSVPAKRLASSPHRSSDPSSGGRLGGEPPRKFQKVDRLSKPVAVPTATYTPSGVPILKVNAALSQVAVPVRQAMLKNLYDHFVVLYETLHPTNPTLAAEHALRQEEEVYTKSSKLTYRNAVISSIAALKKRPFPDTISHPSVGTNLDIVAREEARNSLHALRLTPASLTPFLLSVEDMRKAGFVTEIPEGIGGDRPSEEGNLMKCERCGQQFTVKRLGEAPDDCAYHWGRSYYTTTNGEKVRVYKCCARSASERETCERGPHVFYEKKAEALHLRHPFSHTRPAERKRSNSNSHPGTESEDTALDVVALDCEMIYTTAGMSVARVSVVDGSGTEVFDEFVRADDGVVVIDYNTRFSGIQPQNHAAALLPLASIRKSLDSLINANTIIIGHALENDLKTLRMIHHRCVDTSLLFAHPSGLPYRRALRDLAREHLGRTIQAGGGTVGHSSVEDSIATLDLVRSYVLKKLRNHASPTGTADIIAGDSGSL